MFNFFDQIVLVAAIEWVKFILVIVFVLIWIFNNFLGEKVKAKPRPLQRPQVPPPQPDVPAADPPAGQQQLVGEIEEFLKRATQKRQEKTRRKQPTKVVVKSAPPATSKPARRLVQTSTEDQGFEVNVGGSVAEHVQQHLDTREFTTRAEHLVDDMAKGDVDREAHRKQVFEHKLGRLADTSTSAPESAAAAAEASKPDLTAVASPLAAILANPQNLKQAIALNEILSRPEHRW
jgi:hypothetical protein